MKRKTKNKQRLQGNFPTDKDIIAARKLAKKVDPRLVELMEAKEKNG